jgi:hypothetical protein
VARAFARCRKVKREGRLGTAATSPTTEMR